MIHDVYNFPLKKSIVNDCMFERAYGFGYGMGIYDFLFICCDLCIYD